MKSRNQIIRKLKTKLSNMGIKPYSDIYYMVKIKELVKEGYVLEQARISDKTGNTYYVYSDKEADILFSKLSDWTIKRRNHKQTGNRQIIIKELTQKDVMWTSAQIIKEVKKEGIKLKNYNAKVSDVVELLGIKPQVVKMGRIKHLFTDGEAEEIIKYIKLHTRGQRKSIDISLAPLKNTDLEKIEKYVNEKYVSNKEDFKDKYIKSLENTIKKLTEEHLELKKRIEQIEQNKPRKKFLGIF